MLVSQKLVSPEPETKYQQHWMARTGDNLISKPDAKGRISAKRRDQTRAHGEEKHARQDNGIIVAKEGNQSARGHRGEDARYKERQQLQPGLDCRVAINSLEVDGCGESFG